MGLLYLALVHHPVMNRKGEVVASAVTNLDLHDLARTARTYDLPACFIVTPLEDQQALVHELIRHWCEGVGRELHPDRALALDLLRVEGSVEEACRAVEDETGTKPQLWGTSARQSAEAMALPDARAQLAKTEVPILLMFGTAWGLAPPLLEAADAVVGAIRGKRDYNHLSVRCAAAILVDRLLGEAGV
ncbi:MAG: RNA methyltransferase [Syntrophobacteraceae bacterium]